LDLLKLKHLLLKLKELTKRLVDDSRSLPNTLINLLKHPLIQNLLPKKGRKEKKKVVCYKCDKPGHKSFAHNTEKKISELFAKQP